MLEKLNYCSGLFALISTDISLPCCPDGMGFISLLNRTPDCCCHCCVYLLCGICAHMCLFKGGINKTQRTQDAKLASVDIHM